MPLRTLQRCPVILLTILGIWAATAVTVQAQGERPAADLPQLERFPPLDPEQAMAAFEVAPGYRIELVAAEPLVVDPVAFCFDAQGRLIVVEMRGYSERPDALEGRVRRLSDHDGDGRMDAVETLVEGLSWPTAVACWREGVVVAAAPDVIYVPGDEAPKGGPSPEALAVVARGFGRSNVQGLVNSLRWGLDVRLHGVTSSSDAEIMTAEGSPLRLGRRDFVLTPPVAEQADAWTLEPTDGGGQHGMMIDPWGDKYVCSNSDHLQQVWMLPPRPTRATRVSAEPPRRRSIAVDGPQADVYRSSPVEPWRVLRTHLRVTGQAPGPIEGGGRAAGYFTGATGVYVYDGDAWPESEHPVALVCDVGSNLIHRKHLRPDGLWNTGHRIDRESEFVRSRDTWFRPVQLGTGPDGALYIADMYRETIEHPHSLPPAIKSQLDLNSGNDRGRIWKIVPEDAPPSRNPVDLASGGVSEWVAAIDRSNAWHRRTAARLLVEHRQPASVEPLRRVVRQGRLAEGRLQALATLPHIAGGLDRATLDHALADPHPRVRQRALEIAASARELFPSLAPDQVRTLAEDASIFVRFQLAYEASSLIPDPGERAAALRSVAIRDPEDPWVRWAVEGSLGEASGAFAEGLVTEALNQGWDQERLAPWLRSAAFQMVARDDDPTWETLVRLLDGPHGGSLLGAVAEAMEVRPSEQARAHLAGWTTAAFEAERFAADPRAQESLLRLLVVVSPADADGALAAALAPDVPENQQQVALRSLVGGRHEAIDVVLRHYPTLSPAVQQTAVEVLVEYRQGIETILAALGRGEIAFTSLPVETQRLLREHPDPSLRVPPEIATAMPPATVSAETLIRYQQALSESSESESSESESPESGAADAEGGRQVFRRVCSSCHRAEGEGTAVGPDLKSLVDKPADQILLAILEPNREVDPKYRVVQIETVEGRLVAGIVASETEGMLRVIDSQGRPHEVPRADIADMRTRDRSLMPEQLHLEINPDQMRDLIHFLKGAQP